MRQRTTSIGLVATLCVASVPTGCKETPTQAIIPASEYVAPETTGPTVSSKPGATDSLPATFAPVILTDITASAGIVFHHVTGAFGKKWMPETMGGGGGFIDYDGDHRPDILLINSSYWPGHEQGDQKPTGRLYRNLGNGRFVDVSDETGISKVSCYGMGFTAADYDGDGDMDVYITATGKNHLLRNDEGRFTDVTDEAGVGYSTCNGKASEWEWSAGATWVDSDRDGDLDLFVANYVQWTPETDIWTTSDGKNKTYATPQQYKGATSVLFRNDGNGRFTDVTKQVGVYNPNGKSMSVVADDLNDDGWADLVITNDTQPNFLYTNNQDGTWTDRALSAGMAYDENGVARSGMGVSVADLTNAGPRSIAIGNFSGEPVSLYTQAGADAFIDRAGVTRLAKPTDQLLTFGVLFADLNLDGFDDLLLANGHIEPDIGRTREGWSFAQPPQLFLNDTHGRFIDVSKDAGDGFVKPIVGRALAVADIDNDGDLDVLITENGGSPRLLRNDKGDDNHAVRLRLVSAAPNRDAIGARLHAKVGNLTICRYIATGGSYLSQSELVASIGLGDAKQIDQLDVRWPDGSSETYEKIEVPSGTSATYVVEKGKPIRLAQP